MAYTKTTWVASTAPGISAGNLNNLETQYEKAIVIGEIKLYGGTTAPTNFFLCNGTSFDATAYPALFAITSHYFGGTAAWPHTPNMIGHFPVGYGGAGDYATVGSTGGEETHVLTESEMPSHAHGQQIYAATAGGSANRMLGGGNYTASLTQQYPNTMDAGSDAAHENRPPYVVLNYIIRHS